MMKGWSLPAVVERNTNCFGPLLYLYKFVGKGSMPVHRLMH